MERKFVDVGHQGETEPGLISNLTHAAPGGEGRSEGSLVRARKAGAAFRNEIESRWDQVIAYTRKEPTAALTAAAGLGFLVGLALAIGSRAGTGGRRGWLPQLAARRSFLGRPTRSGWRGLLQLG
jgi:hypothetical protein